MNLRTVIGAFKATGSPDDDGFLVSSIGKQRIIDTGNAGQITNGATPPVVLYQAVQNASSATYAFDNIKISANSVDNLLGSDSFNEISNDFNVFPNPANNILNISNNENVIINKIAITDINGRIVKTENFANISEINLNVSDLKAGLYFTNIYCENGMITRKIMKM